MISFIVPTIGRASLAKTLASIETRPGDEILVVSDHASTTGVLLSCVDDERIRVIDCPRGNDWGHAERNVATPMSRCPHIAHIDDDDVYAPGTRALMEDAIQRHSEQPTLFRMRYPNGLTLWWETVLRCGNIGTPMMLIPNVPEKLGQWGLWNADGKPQVGGDFAFLAGCKWRPEEFVWRPEVIALLGHN